MVKVDEHIYAEIDHILPKLLDFRGKLDHNFASLIPIDTIFVPKCMAPLGLFQIKFTCRYLSNKLCQIAVIWDFGFNSRKRGTRDQQ